MVVVRRHYLDKPFEALVAEDGEELARVPSNTLVLTERERNDGGAMLVRALADERHSLFLICPVLLGLWIAHEQRRRGQLS